MTIALINNLPRNSGMGKYAFSIYKYISNDTDINHVFFDYGDCSLRWLNKKELELKRKVKSLAKNKNCMYLVDASVKNATAVIKKCKSFISNDSGLIQIAVTDKGPRVIGIFGPTNYKRTTPYGKNCYVIRKNLSCSYCLKYPFYSTSSKIKCKRNFECLKGIKVKNIIEAI